ncbi:PorV/PorQ family protein [Candidatus Desantisbacteria bacterium]|nr:PorV/PorQ family protein [Candidatus Desantisbacteria bacterium]
MQYIIILLCMIISLNASAESPCATFLRIGLDARSTGLGEAFCGLSDDAEAIYYNPAGLGFIENTEISLTHTNWLEDIGIECVGLVHPLANGHTIGINTTYLHTQDIIERNRQGTATGRFRVYNFSTGLAYGYQATGKVSLGASLKYISESNPWSKTSAHAADAGVMWQPLSYVSLGASVQNIGNRMQTSKNEYNLPLISRVGIAYKPIDSLVLTMDSISFDGKKPFMAVGIEYGHGQTMILRAGYETNHENTTSISSGIGLRIGEYHVNYAFLPHDDLGLTHMVSICIKGQEKQH